jgi:hypothetical protein
MNISSKDNVSELEKIALILVDEQIYTMSFFWGHGKLYAWSN